MFSCSRLRWPPRSQLFPYTTLFRSVDQTGLPITLEALQGAADGGRSAAQRFGDFSPAPSTVSRTLKRDRKSTRLNSSHTVISYAVFCLKKKTRIAEFVHCRCIAATL